MNLPDAPAGQTEDEVRKVEEVPEQILQKPDDLAEESPDQRDAEEQQDAGGDGVQKQQDKREWPQQGTRSREKQTFPLAPFDGGLSSAFSWLFVLSCGHTAH